MKKFPDPEYYNREVERLKVKFRRAHSFFYFNLEQATKAHFTSKVNGGKISITI